MKSSKQYLLTKTNPQPTTVFFISCMVLVLLGVVSLFIGVASYFATDYEMYKNIILYARLPRIAGAIIAGAGLAGGGAIIQVILSNPLAGPNIIGMNSGAGLTTLLCSILISNNPLLQPVFSFLGSLITVLLIYYISKKSNMTKITLLLSGVVLNYIFNAAIEILYTIFPDTLNSVISFRTGTLSSIPVIVLYPAGILTLLTIIVVYLKSNILEILSLGDEVAFSLGIQTGRVRFFFLMCAACLVGSATSFSGLIGFVGLVVPHVSRLIFGDEVKKTFPITILWGSILMLICDLIARVVFSPYEIPVGIVLSVLGAPIFLFLLVNKRR